MFKKTLLLHFSLTLALLGVFTQPTLGASSSLLNRLTQRIEQWQSSMAGVRASASEAAKGALNGGRVFAVGPQPRFSAEAVGRAGGLMMLKRGVPKEADLTQNDTILAAFVGYEGVEGLEPLDDLIERAGQANARVVIFADGQRKRMSFPPHVTLLPDAPSNEASATTSISNVIGMWAWTGAFIDACVQEGAMPCVYQSYSMPGGRERDEMLQQHFDGRFHEHTNVRPTDSAKLGSRYLATVKKSLQVTHDQEWKHLQQAAKLLQQTRDQGHGVQVFASGHLFPEMIVNPSMPEGWSASRKVDQLKPHQAAIVLEYQAFPWKLIDKITAQPRLCIVTSSQSALPAFTRNNRHIYIDPHWPVNDATVPLQGYDVPVLPSSGVLDAAVYWQLVELSR